MKAHSLEKVRESNKMSRMTEIWDKNVRNVQNMGDEVIHVVYSQTEWTANSVLQGACLLLSLLCTEISSNCS